MSLFNQIFDEHRECHAITTATALLISSAVTAATAVGTSYVERQTTKKTEKAAERRHAENLKMQQQLASQATAPTTKKEANIELMSEEAKEDAAIRSRAKRNRLRVERSGRSGSVGTGLSL